MSMLDLSEESSELSSQTFSTSLRNSSPQTMSQQSFSSSVSQYDEVDDTRFEELVLDRQLKKVLSFDVTDIQAQLLSNPAEAANLRIQYSAGGEEKMFLGSGGEFRRETTAMGICTASSAGSYEIQGSLRPTIELKTVSLSYMNGLMKTTPVTKKDAISRQLIAFVDKSIVVLRESDQDSGQLKYGLWKLA